MGHFNPRPREEGDVLLDDVEQGVDEISIHALVKRATIALISVSLSYIYFNPRPREEGDTTI